MVTHDELHVVFGTGAVGMAVMRTLHGEGKQVRMINRSGAAHVPTRVEVRKGDAADPASITALSAGATVVYLAAQPDYTRWPQLFPPLQAGVLAGAAAGGAKLVVAENLYMYGRHTGALTENTPYAATTRKGRVRAQMAEAVLKAHRDGVVRAVIGRASNFYGPGATTQSVLGEGVIMPLLAGKSVSLLGNPDLPHTYTYIEDFGRGLVLLGQRDEALGQAWHIPNAPTTTTRELLTRFFVAAGLPPKIRAVPRPLIALLGVFNPTMREVDEMMYEFTAPFVVDHGKFTRAFGDIATPQEAAVRQTLDWYRQRDAQAAARTA